MHQPDPIPTASRPARRSAGRVLVGAALALVVATGAAACTATADLSTGSGSGNGRNTDGTAASIETTPPAPASPGQIEPAAPGADDRPVTTCVSGAATTTPFDQGGGRVTCSTVPPDESVSSPPNLDTTIPPPTTQLTVDNTHGVLVVSATGGLACAPDEACPAIGVIMQGTIVVEGADGTVTSAPIDQMGLAGFRLAPGTYDVRAEVTQGECQAGTATLGLARFDVSLSCIVPR